MVLTIFARASLHGGGTASGIAMAQRDERGKKRRRKGRKKEGKEEERKRRKEQKNDNGTVKKSTFSGASPEKPLWGGGLER